MGWGVAMSSPLLHLTALNAQTHSLQNLREVTYPLEAGQGLGD